ncbi:hypothetical protein WJS89_10505 [Sphingomicrobium sp. XHP0235]|uniref:hypothetical protein n=1 Tax=Sphingomicrobium aquimarinum TaxID=3133971 RepID=UPI0031FED147
MIDDPAFLYLYAAMCMAEDVDGIKDPQEREACLRQIAEDRVIWAQGCADPELLKDTARQAYTNKETGTVIFGDGK